MSRVGDLSTAGQALRAARTSRRPALSFRRAAARAGLSETRWRQIEQGYELRAGVKVPVSTTVDTLGRMAAAVGLDPAAVVTLAGMDPRQLSFITELSDPDRGELLIVEGYRVADDATQQVIRTLAERALEDARRAAAARESR